MRRVCNLIAGVVTAFTLAGCSDAPPETGTVQFKGTQSPAIDALRDNMSKNQAAGKSGKASSATAKSASDTKEADPKAATATKADEKP
jgi:hypothetical protein